MKKLLVFAGLLASLVASAQSTDWYTPTVENKPFVRWWWLGSAVDKEGLTYNLEEFASKGLGGFEITPIYGVQGNEENDIDFLSEKWMEMYKHLYSEADRLGLQVDMNCGTGWPFGGPEITPEMAAKRMQINEDGTISAVQTGQMVKRAAPGGEGFVMNHYDKDVLEYYLQKFDKAFSESGAPRPNTWFNDSYEVYNADWTEKFPEIFKEKYGYDIVPYLTGPKDSEEYVRAVCDYRECLGDILRENFLEPWAEWAHSQGAKVRNQSHGSPANILDYYATVDIPECETYGRTVFDIPGLRQDPIIKPNDGDPAVLKLASSAAHITGKKYTSAESLTWMTDHFRTSLMQCKPELDQIFCSGVNHVYFHGAPYSPKGVEWPGWMFYAAINMSPTGSMWADADGLFKYIERCQAFLSAGDPDSDFYLYLPIYDAWSRFSERPYMMFDIHGMGRTLPEAKQAMYDILNAGFDADYISDALLGSCEITKPVIVPACKYMPVQTAQTLLDLQNKGVKVIFIDSLPSDVPGLVDYEAGRKALKKIVKKFAKPVSIDKALEPYKSEGFRTGFGGSMIRRRNEAGGWNYFFAMLQNSTVDGWVKLATPAASAVLYDPLTGESGQAEVRQAADGCAEVRLQLLPGESRMLKTFPTSVTAPTSWKYTGSEGEARVLADVWDISFPESVPAIAGHFSSRTPKSWTELNVPEAKTNFATAKYTTAIDILDVDSADDWVLDLGEVRESARISINGHPVDTLWCVPFRASIGRYLKPGINTVDVYVTNLPSNRIAQMDRDGVQWRIFKDANINTLGPRTFDRWPTDPSGLCSEVKLIPVHYDIPSADEVLAQTRLVNDYFMQKYSDPSQLHPFPSRGRMYESIIWTRAVYYEGLLALYDVDPQQRYYDYTYAWGEANDWGMRNGQTLTRNADNYCCAQPYLDMYVLSGEEKTIEKVRQCMANILSTDESDADWTWIDAIQMGMPGLVRMGNVSGDKAYYEKAWKMYKWSRDQFLNEEDGLWWRDKNFKAPAYLEPNGEDCYWSRGDGWVIAALARVLEILPADDPHRDVYLQDFKNMAAALVKCQREDGLWNPSLHDPTNFGGPEATGSSLFAYGLAWGLRNGVLDDETYRPALAKAWNGLNRICIHDDGFIGYSQGSGKEPKEAQPLSYDRIPDFEDFGTGCFLMAGSEIYRLALEK